METVAVRYFVTELDPALAFYTEHLGFEVELNRAPGFAQLARGSMRLLLSATSGSGGAAQAMPDGRTPEPGGWNRIQLPVTDLGATVAALRAAGDAFRSDIITGYGGKQIVLDDPSGNPVELFEPRSPS